MRLMLAKNISISIGDIDLLDIKQLSIHTGDRIGLVGRNGQGKTLLLHSLLNKTEPFQQVEWKGTVAHFDQLNEKEFSYLSGGEKTVKKLDVVFRTDSDVLFLDEPTNNLDWKRISELEARLLGFKGAFLIVSHDRALLDSVCTKTWELEAGQIAEYSGNYSFYEQEKALQLRQQYQDHENYIKERNRLQDRIRQKQDQAKGMRKPPARMGNSEWQLYKNKAAGKQKQVEKVSKALEKRFDKLEKVDKPMEWDTVKMEIPLSNKVHREYILHAKGLQKVFDNKFLYEVASLKLKTGSKTAIIGENGSGKTTLVKQLLTTGDENIKIASQARIGRFEQALEALPDHEIVYSFVQKDSNFPQHIIRIVLGRLNFRGENVNKRIEVLSGGERVKVVLARLLVGNYNVLILDEPTNHLDLDALRAMEGLIKEYPGTVLFVSHDRRFVEKLANNLWIIEERTVKQFDGTLTEYQELLDTQEIAADESGNKEEIMKLETKLTELISRLSFIDAKDDKHELEQEYERTLEHLRKLRD